MTQAQPNLMRRQQIPLWRRIRSGYSPAQGGILGGDGGQSGFVQITAGRSLLHFNERSAARQRPADRE